MEAGQIITRAEAIANGIKTYFTGKPCPHGHIAPRYVSSWGCTECMAKFVGDEHKKQYLRDYYAKKPKKIKAQVTPTVLMHKDFVRQFKKRQSDANYRANNKNKMRDYNKVYRLENAEKIKKVGRKRSQTTQCKVKRSKYHQRKKANADFLAARTARNLLNKCLERTVMKKTSKTVKMLGYTPQQLRTHLESWFLDGMGWHNRSGWHVDHIVPVAEFIRLGITDPAKINALSNLRPIWAADNMAKKDAFALVMCG